MILPYEEIQKKARELAEKKDWWGIIQESFIEFSKADTPNEIQEIGLLWKQALEEYAAEFNYFKDISEKMGFNVMPPCGEA